MAETLSGQHVYVVGDGHLPPQVNPVAGNALHPASWVAADLTELAAFKTDYVVNGVRVIPDAQQAWVKSTLQLYVWDATLDDWTLTGGSGGVFGAGTVNHLAGWVGPVTLGDTPFTVDEILSTSWQNIVKSATTTIPGSPADGDRYIVPVGSAGLWTGKDNQIATWRAAASAWAFVVPVAGFQVWVTDALVYYTFDGTTWGYRVRVDSNFGTTFFDTVRHLGRLNLTDYNIGPWLGNGNDGNDTIPGYPQCAFNGDSTTAGVGGVAYETLITMPTFNGLTITKSNYGHSGAKIEDFLTFNDTTATYGRIGGLNILVAWGGLNDLAFPYSVQRTYGHLKSYCEHQRALGWKVIVGTIHSVHPASFGFTFTDSDRVAYNALITAGWPEFADGLFDVGADATLGVLNSNPGTGTTYFADGFHLTTAGYTVVAGLVQTAITTLVTNIQAGNYSPLMRTGGTMAGPIAMGTNKITGVGDGSAAQDVPAFHQIPVGATTSVAGTVVLATPSADVTAGHVVQANDTRLSNQRDPAISAMTEKTAVNWFDDFAAFYSGSDTANRKATMPDMLTPESGWFMRRDGVPASNSSIEGLTSTSGTGSGIVNTGVLDNTEFGVVDMSCGTTTSGYATIYGPQFIPGNGRNFFLFRGRTDAVSTSTDQFTLRIGIINSLNGDDNGAYFRYTDTSTGATIKSVTRDHSGAETVKDTTIAWTAATNFKLKIIGNAAATHFDFYVNGILKTAHDVATDHMPPNSVGLQTNSGITKNAGTTARHLYSDYMFAFGEIVGGR